MIEFKALRELQGSAHAKEALIAMIKEGEAKRAQFDARKKYRNLVNKI